MDATRLATVLEQHQIWLATDRQEGCCADLSGCKLKRQDFSGHDLRHARLMRADLRDGSFNGANLQGADLRKADLSRAQLGDAVLKDSRLENCNLEETDLSAARFLKEGQLGGCNTEHASLPESFEFQGLELADEAARNLGVQLISTLMVCLYSWLAIGSTTDLDLLTNAKAISFPFIDISLPIVGLYLVAPVVVFAFFFSFYLHMTIFWTRLASLPAFFPNGEDLCQKIYPTMLNSYINRHMLWLSRRKERRVSDTLNILMIRFGLDGLVLVTLFMYWWRYLPRHDVVGTTLHLVLLFAAIVASWWFHIVLRNRLQMASAKDELRTKRGYLVGVLVLVVLAVMLTVRVFVGSQLPWKAFYAELQYQVVTEKPADEDETASPVASSRGADLQGMNLRFINLSHSFAANSNFARSDLRQANLTEADLRNADLRRVDLRGANLRRAFLEDALLAKSQLSDANLTGTRFDRADLSVADLMGANLSNAGLGRAVLSRADLSRAVLQGAEGDGADFSLARLNGARLAHAQLPNANLFLAELRGARLWKAKLPNASLVLADMRHADLSHADLTHADLAKADLSRAVLFETNLRDARLSFSRLNAARLNGACLLRADLTGAQMDGADLRGAYLAEAQLRDAWLVNARLEGTDLSSAKGLSRKQLVAACIDRDTRLPLDQRSEALQIVTESQQYHALGDSCDTAEGQDYAEPQFAGNRADICDDLSDLAPSIVSQ